MGTLHHIRAVLRDGAGGDRRLVLLLLLLTAAIPAVGLGVDCFLALQP